MQDEDHHHSMPDKANKNSQFRPVNPKQDFVALENQLLEWWRNEDIVNKYLHKNDQADKRYSFLDGPITANNAMGVHHAWGRFYKDAFHRFRNMQGYRQRFQNGFDGQGLWVEVEVEKSKGFKTKREIEQYGVGRFVEECKKRVLHFADVITEQSKRLAYFMDWDNSYHTMSEQNNYAIWNFLKHCNEQGWLYEGEDVMPWCPRCATGLSQHEIVTDGYREVEHESVYVKFPLIDKQDRDTGESLLIWTTTPWTLPANGFASVNPKLTYVKVHNSWDTPNGVREEILWLAKGRLSILKGKHEILEEHLGEHLIGMRYRGPFDELPAQKEAKLHHRVVAWSEASDVEGTGVVHSAPSAGPDDYQIGKKENMPLMKVLDEEGRYSDQYGPLSLRPASELKDEIILSMREKGVLYRRERYRHRYPFCWRCGTELIYRLVSEWFINMDYLREPMMEATREMRWTPGFGKERELDWLKNMSHWMISKKRYWGLALPIYRCDSESCGNVDVIGSKEELKERAIDGWDQFEGNSPHRPWVDAVRINCSKCGSEVTRIKDVGNPWLDAGIIPFSTLSDDPSSKDHRDEWYPADWFSESFPGQFRNWFYSLIAMSVGLKGKRPADAVFSYALMRDENGEEMHKSRGNSIQFEEAADTIGVDVMRWLFGRHDPASNLNFGSRACDEVRRQFIIPLWNVYSFFTTYANLDGWKPTEQSTTLKNLTDMDRWVLAELNSTIKTTTEQLENWRIELALRDIEKFIDRLSNWYVRRSRRRFWKSHNDDDKAAAYATLYECLVTLSKLLAPFTPFLAEDIYRNLVAEQTDTAPISVHLTDWPQFTEETDADLVDGMRLVLRLIEMGRRCRAKADRKVRQPLKEMLVATASEREAKILADGKPFQEMIKDELNIKAVGAMDVTMFEKLNEVTIKPNFVVLGPRYGKKVQDIKQIMSLATPEQHRKWSTALTSKQPISINDEIELKLSDVLIQREDVPGYAVISENNYTVALNTDISAELRDEGWAREVVHHIQGMRKNQNLEIADRIKTRITASPNLLEALRKHEQYIRTETLAVDLEFTDEQNLDGSTPLPLGEETLSVRISKA